MVWCGVAVIGREDRSDWGVVLIADLMVTRQQAVREVRGQQVEDRTVMGNTNIAAQSPLYYCKYSQTWKNKQAVH